MEDKLFHEFLEYKGLKDIDPLEYIYWRDSVEFQSYLLKRAWNDLGVALCEAAKKIADLLR